MFVIEMLLLFGLKDKHAPTHHTLFQSSHKSHEAVLLGNLQNRSL